jgi:DNA damage-inducible protein 1
MQASIEQQIRRANIEENFRQAMEHTPEAFGKVPLLRVRCQVDRAEVVAVVDTGAEATIMSRGCAERLGLMRLVDERFQGTALGVGSTAIVGR